MKKLILLLVLFSCFTFTQAQIIINELQSDAGNYESAGGDWIELKNIDTTAVDMSCWRLTNGGSVIITIPQGLIVPAGGYLLIGRGSRVMCSNCDYKSLAGQFTLNIDGFGPGMGVYANTIYLNTDDYLLGGCDCLNGTGNFNNGSGSGDRIILNNNLGITVDAMMFAGGANYGGGPITVNFPATPTCGVSTVLVPDIGDNIYSGRIICNDLSGCNSSYARLPDGNNGSVVTYDQGGNLACTNCFLPCVSGATNTASTDYPTPGLSNSNSATTWTATLNGAPFTASTMSMTVCGATPLTFNYSINGFTNVALTATQASGSLGSYTTTNGGTPTNFSGTNYSATTGITTLQTTVTPPNGTTTYEFVWGEGNANCTSCPGSSSTAVPGTATSTQSECYTLRKLTVTRENTLGGTPAVVCTIPGTITVNGATGTNLEYTLQKQTTIGGAFVTISGPQSSDIFGGIIDDDADPVLPNYRVLISSVNTVCPNPTPLIAPVPNGCLGNPACPKFVTTGTGAPTFTLLNGSPACASSQAQFSVDITGVCTSGQVEVKYDYNPAFDPYTQGTLIGTVGTTVGVTPPTITATGRVFINEFVVRPFQGTCVGTPDGLNPNSGEWVELYNDGPGNVDIGGWKISDGDWTATIPAGTIINAGLHYLIGGGGTFCSSGVTPDLNIETCNCATVSPSTADIMNLTNGTEQLALFDINGNMVDGVQWGGGQGLPDTLANIAPIGGCGNYIPPLSVSLPAVASFAASGTVGSSPNSGKYRTNTNTWVTSTFTSTTPKATNPGGNWNGGTAVITALQGPAPPVNATIFFNLPDTCSLTGPTSITLKAIYKPDPIAPCTKSDVTASVTYTIPACELLSMNGDGEYCAPATAPVSLTTSSPLTVNYDVALSNGTDTVHINPLTGAGPFSTNVTSTGLWSVVNIVAPSGYCPPKTEGDADVIINALPVITGGVDSASFCNQYSIDLTTLESSFITTPPVNYFIWYDSAVGGSALIPPYVNPAVSTMYYVAATTGLPANCEGVTRKAIWVTVDPVPQVPNVSCHGDTVTFTPSSPNCAPTPCASGIEYSIDGINWSAGPSFLATDPGWSGFGSPSNSLVYFRNVDIPGCFRNATYFTPCAAPLPTQLFDFYGRMNQTKGVDLVWQTAQEINASHFEIEKSADKTHFSKIAEIKANGNTSTLSRYTTTDGMPYYGSNYYRLKMVDIDQQYVYSNIILVHNTANQSGISALYPNPASSAINVELNAAKGERTTIQILDALGKFVLQQPIIFEKGFNKAEIPLIGLAKGHYTLRIPMSNATLIKKFVKE